MGSKYEAEQAALIQSLANKCLAALHQLGYSVQSIEEVAMSRVYARICVGTINVLVALDPALRKAGLQLCKELDVTPNFS